MEETPESGWWLGLDASLAELSSHLCHITTGFLLQEGENDSIATLSDSRGPHSH